MKKVNFKKLEIFTDITKKKRVTGDGSKDFANILYTSCNGIVAHSLAFKIYESEGEIEISEQEEALIRQVAQERCTPAFMDGVLEQLNRE